MKKIYLRIFFAYMVLFLFLLFVNGNYAFALENPAPDYDAISEQIAADVEKCHIPGMAVMVVDQDSILFQETYGNCSNIDTPFIIGSMSKSFTAVAIMQLVEEGKIDLDRPVADYMDAAEWFVDSADCHKITVRDLLNQTSGIAAYQTFGNLSSADSYGHYIYANANYGLLGLIVEAVSGQSYEDYITMRIFEPLGMTYSATSLEKSEENGLISGYRNYYGIPIPGKSDFPGQIEKGTWTNVPAGYLSSSASDMGKYLQMYLRGGEQVLSPESIHSMFYDNVPADGDFYYGMGWNYSTEMFRSPMLWHAGLVENYTSYMFILPEEGIGVVVLVNMNDYLVTNNLIGNIVNPLIGEERQDQPNLYVILHLGINLVCFLLCFASIWSVVTLKRRKTGEKKISRYLLNGLCHVVLPAVLFCIPFLLGIPPRVLWLFVKDLCIVIYVNAVVLTAVGIYKLLPKSR